MQITRSESREKIMTILYQIALYNNKKIKYNIEELIENNIEETNDFIETSVKEITEKQETIDQIANKYLESWPLNRLGYTDQAILRLAIYEIIETETPNKVCINEAIELAKKYSDEDVVKMINGVLDKVYHNEANNE